MSRITALDIVGVVSPAAVQVAEPRAGDPPLYKTVVPGAALGVLGAVAWPEHRVLGFLAGDAIGVNAFRLWRGQGDDRARAGCNLVTAGAAIAGSLAWSKHPFFGWCLGFLVGSVATSFVNGSTTSRFKGLVVGGRR